MLEGMPLPSSVAGENLLSDRRWADAPFLHRFSTEMKMQSCCASFVAPLVHVRVCEFPPLFLSATGSERGGPGPALEVVRAAQHRSMRHRPVPLPRAGSPPCKKVVETRRTTKYQQLPRHRDKACVHPTQCATQAK